VEEEEVSLPPFLDLGDLGEDERIRKIGNYVTELGKVASVVVDDEPGKLLRYVTKLQAWFPGIRILSQGKGPVANTAWVKVGPPTN
jgi:hypothetical protein